MQTRAMLDEWVDTLREPWTKPLSAPASRTEDLERTARLDPAAFRYLEPATLLRRVCLRTREAAAARNVALLSHCACGPVWVHGEPFAGVLFDLVSDAIAATGAGPVLIRVREGTRGDSLWQIRDTTERDVQHVRACAIVEGHGGLLRFDSSPGTGSRVSVWLPRPSLRQRATLPAVERRHIDP